MAKKPANQSKQGSSPKDLARIAAGLKFLGDGAAALTDAGNSDMPGFIAFGMAEVFRWAAEQLTGEPTAQHGDYSSAMFVTKAEKASSEARKAVQE
jgi:hypothetical protein